MNKILAVSAIALVALAACERPSTPSRQASTGSGTSASSGLGRQVRVVEQGYTSFDQTQLTLGLIVQNDGDTPVVAEISPHPVDPHGRAIVLAPTVRMLTPPIGAHQRTGVGYYLVGPDFNVADFAGRHRIERIDYSINGVRPAGQRLIRLAAGNLTMGVADARHPDGRELTFTVDSAYGTTLTHKPEAVAVLRNRDGKIIGGTPAWSGKAGSIPPGRSKQAISLEWSIPGIDVTRSQVYLCPQACDSPEGVHG